MLERGIMNVPPQDQCDCDLGCRKCQPMPNPGHCRVCDALLVAPRVEWCSPECWLQWLPPGRITTSARQITVEPSEAEKAQRRLDPAAYAEQVIVNEAWYNCRVHGTVHHPLGPDTDTPCPQCAADDRGLARDE